MDDPVGTAADAFKEIDGSGAVSDAADVVYQPIIGVRSRLKCRGQVLDTTKLVTYEVSIKEIGYDGWLMIEAFGLALPELVAATKIWRRMYESEEQLARDGLAFMKAEYAKRW